MSKTVYYAQTEEVGEVEGMFDEDGELLGMWSCNDACWQNEYFSEFLDKLGVYVVEDGRFDDKLEKIAEEMWG